MQCLCQNSCSGQVVDSPHPPTVAETTVDMTDQLGGCSARMVGQCDGDALDQFYR